MKKLLVLMVIALSGCSSMSGLTYSNKTFSATITNNGVSVNSGVYFNFE